MNKKTGLKTHIRDVPVCNERLYQEVGALMKMQPSQIQEMAEFVGGFVAATMKCGQMQAVMLPYFGKFQPKPKMIRQYNKIKQEEGNGMDLLKRAILGKPVIDKRNPPDYGSKTL